MLALTLKVLVNSVLHRVNSLFKAAIPVILNSIVCSAHEFIGDQTPFFGTLVS